MDRVFRSGNPFTTFRPSRQSRGPKPQGLWYSCGSAWDDWCRSEMPEWIEEAPYVYRLRVELSRMLVLRHEEDLARFTTRYSIGEETGDEIDWRAVAKRYEGIEICPHHWGFRRVPWYNAWNVASGCIWGAGAFRGVEMVETCSTPAVVASGGVMPFRIGAVAIGSAVASAAITHMLLSRG